MTISRKTALIAGSAVLCAALACSEEKKPEAVASAAPAPTPKPAPPPDPPKPERPKRPEKIDTELTAERRSKLEAENSDAKGFLVAGELEKKLKANKTLKAKEAGVAAFDKMASGHWVLFAGPISNPTDSGFDLGITYTPQMAGDVMGMSRQWFPVTFADIKDYDSSALKSGQVVVVLAKYTGKQKAGPGQELVAAGLW